LQPEITVLQLAALTILITSQHPRVTHHVWLVSIRDFCF